VAETSKMLTRDAPVIAAAIIEAVRSRGVDVRSRSGSGLEGLVSKLREVLRGRALLAYLFSGRAKEYT